ncbi:hypothetical protein AYI69_g3514 [Smittium culicis]|uniref:Uncharacterized protein n=1 Tax=Smittium culicis TaxID=133412 RepID=A0A1R1YJF9_9FUNG|nr:hypothetical protein AYI69_g7276 [Smittium culicis]OMJ27057.1 hypothetical protein AYI69_g3514 [Smittium culicis]
MSCNAKYSYSLGHFEVSENPDKSNVRLSIINSDDRPRKEDSKDNSNDYDVEENSTKTKINTKARKFSITLWGPIIVYALISLLLFVLFIVYKKEVSQNTILLANYLQEKKIVSWVRSSVFWLRSWIPVRVYSGIYRRLHTQTYG